MSPQKIYSPVILKTVKIIAIFTLLILILSLSRSIPEYIKEFYGKDIHIFYKISYITRIAVNLITIVFAIILIFHPHKFFLIGLGSLLQSLSIATFSPYSYMSQMMLCITIGTFLVRTNQIFNKTRQIIFIAVIYLYELLIPFIYDDVSVIIIMEKLGGTFTLLITIFFFYQFAKQNGLREGAKEKVLNLANYPGLERSDMLLLQDVLNKMKYKEIAQKIHGSEGALRNKLSKIYKILEVGDRTGFMTIYSGYELIYEP